MTEGRVNQVLSTAVAREREARKVVHDVSLARFTDSLSHRLWCHPAGAISFFRRPQFAKWPPMGVRDRPSSGSGIGGLQKVALAYRRWFCESAPRASCFSTVYLRLRHQIIK
jgi:hypothetical protein